MSKKGHTSKRICEKCNKEFFVPPSYLGRFCSVKCTNEFRKGENSVNWKGGKPRCKVCGKILSIRGLTYCLKHAVEKAKYKISGANNYNWKGGVTPVNKKIRDSMEYADWRKSVFERDNFICNLCGKRGGILQAHHVLPFIDFPEYRFNLDNGKTLCKECHAKIRKSEWKYVPLFMNI